MSEIIIPPMTESDGTKKLRYGWTTGACATAATKAALHHLLTGEQLKTVTITLPKGQSPSFDIEHFEAFISPDSEKASWSKATIIKDAGDDPDVTHGALISATVNLNPEDLNPENLNTLNSGIVFKAGQGVGTVTRPGLPLDVGQPAINPVPRQMMQHVTEQLCQRHGKAANVTIEISVANGEKLAEKTLNGRLGIIGGISILGTTGIVVPYSCSAWIHSIHRGIDVAKATGAQRVAACVGSTSERLIKKLYPELKEEQFIDMGDFVGGTLKYFRKVPIPTIIIAGGFGKLSKLAQGKRDLHSKRSTVDIGWLAEQLILLNASQSIIAKAKKANTALEILNLATEENLALGNHIAKLAQHECHKILRMENISVEIRICDRNANLVGEALA